MDTNLHNLINLLAQLGLDNSKAGIDSFLILDGIHGDLFGAKTNQ